MMEKDLKEQKVSDCIDYFGGQLKDQFKNSKRTTYCDYRQLSLTFHCQATTEMQPFGCKSANLRYKTPVWYPEIDNLLKSRQLPRSKLRATAENDQNQKIYITDGNKKQRQTNAFAQHHSLFGAICVAPGEQYSCLTTQYCIVFTQKSRDKPQLEYSPIRRGGEPDLQTAAATYLPPSTAGPFRTRCRCPLQLPFCTTQHLNTVGVTKSLTWIPSQKVMTLIPGL